MKTEVPSVAKQIQVAQQCLGAGNLTAADLLCRVVLEREPHQAQAFNSLGIIAAQLARFEEAQVYFETASALGLDAARGNLATLVKMTSAATAPKSHADRFILIKSWGQGFWSEVTHVLGGLLLAEITDRVPVVHWSGKNLYGGTAQSDGFGAFFSPVSAAAIDDVIGSTALDIYPQKWTVENLRADFPTQLPSTGFTGATAAALDLLGRRERLIVADYHLSVAELASWLPRRHPLHRAPVDAVFRHLIAKYLKPVQSVAEECNTFFARHLAGAPSVAIHLRGGDKPFEDRTIIDLNNECLRLLAQLPSDTKIFGMTDDSRYAEHLTENYRTRVVIADCERTSQNTGVHFHNSGDVKRRGLEIMRDTYIGIKADRFIGCGSTNVAAMAAMLRDWPDGQCTIQGPSYLTSLGVRLYLHLPSDILAFLYAP